MFEEDPRDYTPNANDIITNRRTKELNGLLDQIEKLERTTNQQMKTLNQQQGELIEYRKENRVFYNMLKYHNII